MLRFSETFDKEFAEKIHVSVIAYKDMAINNELTSTNYYTASIPQSPLIKIFNVISTADASKRQNPFFMSFMKSLDDVRASRYDRLLLKSSHISNIKYGLLFVFGILTQLAIAAVHRSSKEVLLFTVMLFSIGFSVTIFVIECLNWPYEYPYFIDKSMFNLVS